jgi:hypothetical protein
MLSRAPRFRKAVLVGSGRSKCTGLADPRIKARFAELGGTVFMASPTDFGEFIAEETEKWSKVIRAANIKSE